MVYQKFCDTFQECWARSRDVLGLKLRHEAPAQTQPGREGKYSEYVVHTLVCVLTQEP